MTAVNCYNGDEGLSRGARALLGADFYRVPDLSRTLTAIKRLNLNLQSNRDIALEQLYAAMEPAPFGWKQRFPAGEDYVTEYYGGWNKAFEQLRTALSYRDSNNLPHRGNNGGGTTNPPNPARPEQPESQSGDAFKSAHSAVSAMIAKIRGMEDVLDQVEFERKFNLKWVGADGKTVPPKKVAGDEEVSGSSAPPASSTIPTTTS